MFRTILAYSMMLAMPLPSASAWQHLLDGHFEIHCHENIPNHIHQAEFSCDFYQVHFSISLQSPALELGVARSGAFGPILSGFHTMPGCKALRLCSLRAPPV